ncbi:acetylornithine aminotransferase [Catalinimonas alkaloidigena]|uniref:Acetylornithine aminotransferase n=1 Tax=Catalinimonas alkaloidigena TaxID=1075417 RepID=A0A1G9T5P1_9BACT|nr:aminotransferase class III-fold pyridoxal phosphate-dependent enzyme [Catalinimonas alkaloidigena]SDM42920.1 acetylornithine aminotransferase [Catalinimonas alkaloidigena]
MKTFDVYPLYNIEPVRAEGCYLWDAQGTRYLDLYGGHAVISIGHCHPHYAEKVSQQVHTIGFYSNSVQNGLQEALAEKLGRLSGYDDYALFLCNSGAEANENALKLASFHTGRKRIVALKKAFHGRTSAAVAATDNPKIVAPVNAGHEVTFIPFNDVDALETELRKGDVCALIVEGIQGVGGVHIPTPAFWQRAAELCKETGTVLIADEIQSGYGRSGKFFAHQYADIQPDLITVAKGMGNGFPIGGVLVAPHLKPVHGMLGTTFGGNHLACAAGLAVLDVLEDEGLVAKAAELGAYWMDQLRGLDGVKEVRGQGLMIGLEFDFPVAALRKSLLFDYQLFTGASGTNIIRLLPPLNLTQEQADLFTEKLEQVLSQVAAS